MNRAQLWNELKNIVTRKNIKNNLQWKYATKKLIQDEITKLNQSIINVASIVQQLKRNVPEITRFTYTVDLVKNIEIGTVIEYKGSTFIHTNNKRTANWLYQNTFYADEVDDYETYTENIESNSDNQIYRLSERINCLIDPLLEKIQSKIDNTEGRTKRHYNKQKDDIMKLADQFQQYGATNQLIQDLSKQTKSSIVIYNPLSGERIREYIYPNASNCYEFINVSFNHVEAYQSLSKKQTTVVSQQELNELAVALKQQNQVFSFSTQAHSKQNYKSIIQGHQEHMEEKAYLCREQERLLNQDQQDLRLVVNVKQLYYIQQYLNHPGNKRIKQQYDENQLKHVDIKQGYTSHRYLPEVYRLGFPYISEFRYCDIDTAIKYNGIYECIIEDELIPQYILDVLQTERHPKYYIISAIIKFLISINVQVKVVGGMYGSSSRQIDYTDEQCVKYNQHKPYFMQASKNEIGQSCDMITKFHCPSREMASILSERNNKIVRGVGDSSYYIITKKNFNQDNQTTMAHVSAFILQYQTLWTLLQLKEMKYDKVVSITGDDIYYEDHQFKLLDQFAYKNELKKITDCTDYFIRNSHSQYCDGEEVFEYGQPQQLNIKELHLGPGGHGKSFQQHNDKGLINKVYITLTNQLVQEQQNKYPHTRCLTADMLVSLLAKNKIPKPSVIILDELGLTGMSQVNKVLLNNTGIRIIVLGDELQLSTPSIIQQDVFNRANYDYVYSENNYKTDYRAKCDKLRALKQLTRDLMRRGTTEYDIYYKYIVPSVQKVQKSNVYKHYRNTDIIITPENQNNADRSKYWTDEMIKQGISNKWRVNRSITINNISYNTGDILTDISHQLQQYSAFTLQHSYTAHSLQGSTFSNPNKVFINPPVKEDLALFKGYCYTAISRLEDITQLIAIVPDIRIQ